MIAETAWLLWAVALVPAMLCAAIAASYVAHVVMRLARRHHP